MTTAIVDPDVAPPIAALAERARQTAGKNAYADQVTSCTWSEIWERTRLLAGVLASLGVEKGDVVALLSPDRLVTVEHWFACAYLGAVRTAINPRYAPAQMNELLKASKPKVLLAEHTQAQTVAHLDPAVVRDITVVTIDSPDDSLDYERLMTAIHTVPRPVGIDLEDICAICFTSGTSGAPKGARWTHHSVREAQVRTFVQAGLGADDTFMHCSPSAGVPILSATWNVYNGAMVVLRVDLRPEELIKAIERHRVTSTLLVPTLLSDLLGCPALTTADLSSLELVIYGSAPAPEVLVRRAVSTLRTKLQQWYGSTEGTGGWYCILHHEDHLRALDGSPHLLRSCGRPTDHCLVEVQSPTGQVLPPHELGEVAVTSETVFAGYLGQPSGTTSPRRQLLTGDIGYKDHEGYVNIVDRKHRMIVTGGYNVYPSAVEAALLDIAGVQEACVVGIPDSRWGHVVGACIVSDRGIDLSEAREWCGRKLSRFELPKLLIQLDSLPRKASLKIDYSAVADCILKGEASDRPPQ
ncbi:MAG: class I adenylate-forming enzyme family protein [Acidimicrobiales bacterium]